MEEYKVRKWVDSARTELYWAESHEEAAIMAAEDLDAEDDYVVRNGSCSFSVQKGSGLAMRIDVQAEIQYTTLKGVSK